jgi:hypothetical protein
MLYVLLTAVVVWGLPTIYLAVSARPIQSCRVGYAAKLVPFL